jgi:hypothetical protein
MLHINDVRGKAAKGLPWLGATTQWMLFSGVPALTFLWPVFASVGAFDAPERDGPKADAARLGGKQTFGLVV